MLSLRPVLVGLATLGAVVAQQQQQQQQQSSPMSLMGLLHEIPKCAIPCTLRNVQEAGCPTLEITALQDCYCTNVTMLSQISTCVQQSCQFTDVVTAVRTQRVFCEGYPQETRVQELTRAAIAGLVIAPLFLVARCVTRLQQHNKLFMDDWTAIMATVFFFILAALELACTRIGFGYHYWDVHDEDAVPLLQMFYVGQILYILCHFFTKISILMLYKNIFITQWFQTAVNFFIAFMVVQGLLYVLLIVFQCLPIEANWDLNLLLDRKCIDVNAVGYSGAAVAIIEDAVLIVLPIPLLRDLNMDTHKRVGTFLIFAMASFASITSIVRLKYLVQFANTYDPSWDNIDSIVWSLMEILTAIICGCLPALRKWWKPLIPKITIQVSWSWSATRSRNTDSDGKKSGSKGSVIHSAQRSIKESVKNIKRHTVHRLSAISVSPSEAAWMELSEQPPPPVPPKPPKKAFSLRSHSRSPSFGLPRLTHNRKPTNSSALTFSDDFCLAIPEVQVTYDIEVSSTPRRPSADDTVNDGIITSISGAEPSPVRRGRVSQRSLSRASTRARRRRNNSGSPVTSVSRPNTPNWLNRVPSPLSSDATKRPKSSNSQVSSYSWINFNHRDELAPPMPELGAIPLSRFNNASESGSDGHSYIRRVVLPSGMDAHVVYQSASKYT